MRFPLIALALLPACTVRCGSSPTADAAMVEQLARSLGEKQDQVRSVHCPEVAAVVGTRFDCEVVFTDGTQHALKGIVEPGDGKMAYFVALDWRKMPLGTTARGVLARLLTEKAGVPVEVHCGKDHVLSLFIGEKTRCTMQLGGDRIEYDVWYKDGETIKAEPATDASGSDAGAAAN